MHRNTCCWWARVKGFFSLRQQQNGKHFTFAPLHINILTTPLKFLKCICSSRKSVSWNKQRWSHLLCRTTDDNESGKAGWCWQNGCLVTAHHDNWKRKYLMGTLVQRDAEQLFTFRNRKTFWQRQWHLERIWVRPIRPFQANYLNSHFAELAKNLCVRVFLFRFYCE